MKQFIAELGYTMAWAFTIPEYTLEEKFEEYFNFGLSMIICMATIIAICVIALTFILIKERKDKRKES